MTFHNYPNEWLPEIDYNLLSDPVYQYKLTKLISVNGYCIVKNCPTSKDSVLQVADCVSSLDGLDQPKEFPA